jgi:hypothetical protein
MAFSYAYRLYAQQQKKMGETIPAFLFLIDVPIAIGMVFSSRKNEQCPHSICTYFGLSGKNKKSEVKGL